jgi:hypothetical protein
MSIFHQRIFFIINDLKFDGSIVIYNINIIRHEPSSVELPSEIFELRVK